METNPNIFLKIEGIDGESTADGFEKQIEVFSLTWQIENNTSPLTVQGGNATAREMSLAVNLTPKAAVGFLNVVSAGKSGKKTDAKVTVCRTGDKLVPYITFEMKNVLVTLISQDYYEGAGNGSSPQQVKLAFPYLKYEFSGTDLGGAKQAKPDFVYDIAKSAGK